jgi:hypothetical protein
MASEKSDTHKQEGGNPMVITPYIAQSVANLFIAQIKSADMVRSLPRV